VKEIIENRLAGTTPTIDPIAAALAALPPGVADVWFEKPLIPAAVLIPLVHRGDALSILLTQRTEHLKDHPGQISFPGGRVEPADDGPVATALREVHEETGIAPEQVRVIGYLEPLAVVTGFAVTPVVGFVSPDFELRLDEYEVAEAFEVPLPFLLDESNLVRSSRKVRGIHARLYEFNFEERRIWGATAEMLRRFVRLISD
jgi:8-oxo-dGTP pyrophosphatase MutT (NUDIX family)